MSQDLSYCAGKVPSDTQVWLLNRAIPGLLVRSIIWAQLMCMNSQGSGQTEQICRLARAFPVCLCDNTVMILSFQTNRPWTNSADPDQTAPRACTFCSLDSLLYGRATLFKFQNNYSNFLGVQIFRNFTVIHLVKCSNFEDYLSSRT